MSRSRIPSAGRLGLILPGASADLDELGWNRDERLEVLWALGRAASPDLALRALMRLRAAVGDGEWAEIDDLLSTDTRFRGRLLGLLGASSALGDHLVANPDRWRTLDSDSDLPGPAAQTEILLAAVDAQPDSAGRPRSTLTGAAAVTALRIRYRDLVLALAARDLAAVVEDEPVLPFYDVSYYLSELADAALTAALAVALTTVLGDKPYEGQLAVIAMGKCGARELNYVSDVDVVFVAEPADQTSVRIASEMMRIGTEAFFEVDAALRPEGKSGALTRTLDAHLSYYQRWAKTWEFQALLKARAMTGDMDLAQRYIDAVGPMVWNASEREDFVADLQRMRRRVEENVPPDLRARELKLGPGGLRDVEFAVQLLQMVHGKADPTVRPQSTIDALRALTKQGYVGRDDGANLVASYEFLRLLEHRLQLQRMLRTHLLPDPDDDEGMRWLARAAHIRPDGDNSAAGVLRNEIRRQATRVRRLHEKLFYRPLLEAVTRFSSKELTLSDDSAIARLQALGYDQPRNALGHLKALVQTSGRKGQIQALLLPTLMETLSRTPDPDAGLLHYRRLCDVVEDRDWFLRLLRDDGVVADRLMTVLGSSVYISELLMKAPDVIRLYAGGVSGPKLVEVSRADVAQGLIAAAKRQSDPKRAIAVARSQRRAELARIASADLLGMVDVQDVAAALSSVWAAVLNAALEVVVADTIPDGQTRPARIAVIGMGRLGGHEIGYGSDADVLFVCDPNPGHDEDDAVRWANQVADKVRSLLGSPSTDPPLEVDVDLRPEGRNGPVVRSLAAYRAYYAKWAQPWEVQALLRAIPVAGDEELGAEFVAVIDPVRYPAGGVSLDTVKEIRRIKARVDAERLPRGADPATHTKLGRGGLADVEWTVQLVQLQHAHDYPSLHNTSTLQTLDAIEEVALLAADDVALLREAWLTATKARNALVLVRGKPTDQLPGPGRVLAGVAAVAGWPSHDSNEFLDNYLRVTRRAKRVVQEVFGGITRGPQGIDD